MRLVIWTIHSMTLETDKWKHESTDWDINIWMKRDARNQFISGSSPKWRSKGKMTGNLRIEHFPASFTTSPTTCWSRNYAPHFFHSPHLIFHSSHTEAHVPALPPQFSSSCYTKGHSETLKGPLWWQLEFVGLGSRTNIITPQNNLWARLWGV